MAPTNRLTGKSAAFAARYGTMPTSMVNSLRGNNPVVTFHDEMIFEGLQAKRRPWAKAFKEVLGVGMQFYVNADGARKDWLENHYRVLATHNTPKGRKAAKVVAVVVAAQLAPEITMADFEARVKASLTSGLSSGGYFMSAEL